MGKIRKQKKNLIDHSKCNKTNKPTKKLQRKKKKKHGFWFVEIHHCLKHFFFHTQQSINFILIMDSFLACKQLRWLATKDILNRTIYLMAIDGKLGYSVGYFQIARKLHRIFQHSRNECEEKHWYDTIRYAIKRTKFVGQTIHFSWFLSDSLYRFLWFIIKL